MDVLAKARRFMLQSREQRTRKLRGLTRYYLGYFVFRICGRCVNRARSPFLVVYRPDFDYDFDKFPEYREFHRIWTTGVETSHGGDINRLNLLYLNLAQVMCDGVPGDFVELGVYKGNSASILHQFSRQYGRRLFLFDTFQGFDRRDLTGIDANMRHSGFTDTSLDAVRRFVGSDDVVCVPGFFPKSANAIALPEAVAVLHIDCDLYAPMKAGLEVFYPRMTSGGVMLLHDYASGHWPGTRTAIDEFFADKAEHLIVMPDKAGTAAVRKI
jgi:hypothetical protein